MDRAATRGCSSTVWCAGAERPPQEALDPEYDPWAGYEWPDRAGQLERAPRKKPPA